MATRRRRQVSFTMDPDLYEVLKDAAWSHRMNFSRFVEHAIRTYLAEHSSPPNAD